MSNPKALSFQDTHQGQKVTVLSWTDPEENSWCGTVMTVAAKQYPFVMTTEDIYGPVALDFRRCYLMELSDEYAKAGERK